MKTSMSVRTGALGAVAALILTVGMTARRAVVGGQNAAPEELRDAVASPAIPAGARSVPLGYFVRPGLSAKRPVVASRLDRLADALDAQAAALRRSASR